MATVRELTDPYVNVLLAPLPPGSPDVCRICLTFTTGFTTCYPCGHQPEYADAVLPISYSPHFGQLHTVLAGYKRGVAQSAQPLRMQLAAILWRFLDLHEPCLANAAGVASFDVVTTVPSGSRERDQSHPLRGIVSDVVQPTRDRYERLLTRSGVAVPERVVDPEKYEATRDLHGESVLVIDDTWTTGANAQSTAGALKRTGAGAIGVLVIGRHVQPSYQDNEARLKSLPGPFAWERCALHQR